MKMVLPTTAGDRLFFSCYHQEIVYFLKSLLNILAIKVVSVQCFDCRFRIFEKNVWNMLSVIFMHCTYLFVTENETHHEISFSLNITKFS